MDDPVVTALKAVKKAAKRAASRCDMESGQPFQDSAASIKWSALSMLEDALDEVIADAEADERSPT